MDLSALNRIRDKINKIKYYSAKLSLLLDVDDDDLVSCMLEKGMISENDYKEIKNLNGTLN